MFRTVAIRTGLLCLAFACFPAFAPAQSKIAVIDFQKAIQETDEAKKELAALSAKYKGRQDDLAKLQADMQSIEQQLNSGKLNQQAAADLQIQGQRKEREAQHISEDLQADSQRDSQEIGGRLAQKMKTVVTKLCEEKGLDVLVDVAPTLYFKPALDVTADAVAAYNKAYPAK
jgi:outer membrane protein